LSDCGPYLFATTEEETMRTISSHSDYHHSDYFFERTQSRTMQTLDWGKTEAPIRSWSEYLYPTLVAVSALAAVVEVIH
jgi:hypothetical protein